MRALKLIAWVGVAIAAISAWHVRSSDDAVIATFFGLAGGTIAGAALGAGFVLGWPRSDT